jgi:hypothetical protein
MELSSVIGKEHPSFGCRRATFIFAMAGGRLILVEAANAWAVALVERLCGTGQRVSEHCSLQAVVRDHGSVGTRSESVSEVQLVDFVLDVADRSLLVEDVVTMYSLSMALSPDERSYLEEKLDSDNEEIDASRVNGLPPVPEPRGPSPIRALQPAEREPAAAGTPSAALAALQGLGFPKKDVERWAAGFNPGSLGVGDVVKAGCRALAGGAR